MGWTDIVLLSDMVLNALSPTYGSIRGSSNMVAAIGESEPHSCVHRVVFGRSANS